MSSSTRRSRPAGGPASVPSVPRAVNSASHQAALAYRLTPRDGWLLRMLHEHRVFTAEQICSAAFPSPNAGRRRLRELYQWSVADRFHPSRAWGNAPLHYVLGPAGATVLAADAGVEPTTVGYRRERAMSIAHSPRLTHLLGVNAWFIALITAAAHAGGPTRLRAWWSEARCARYFGDLVRPDAYGRWHHPRAGELEFFLEYDRGTETTARVAGKLDGYAALATATGIPTPVLVWLPTAAREATVRPVLARAWRDLDEPHRVPIATASAELLHPADPHASPADALWLPLHPRATDSAGARHRLHELRHTWPHMSPPATGSTPDPNPTAPSPTTLPAPHPMPPPATRTTGRDEDSTDA